MSSSFMTDRPYEVTHRTNTSHWCAGCWSWVVDCIHCANPLRMPHRLTPKDTYVHSFAYDPARERLEVFYRWKDGAQYFPISPGMFQQIERRADIHGLLAEWIKQRRITWQDVRTERKVVTTMLCGVSMIVEKMLAQP